MRLTDTLTDNNYITQRHNEVVNSPPGNDFQQNTPEATTSNHQSFPQKVEEADEALRSDRKSRNIMSVSFIITVIDLILYFRLYLD